MEVYNTIKNAGKTALVYILMATQTLTGASNLEQTIEPEKPSQTINASAPLEKNPVDMYSILVSGNSDKYESEEKDRFWLALTDIYTSLIESGVKKDNIHVLYPLSPNKNLSRNREISDYLLSEENKHNVAWSSKENLKSVLDGISEKADNNDILMIYFCGHGEYKDETSSYRMLKKGHDGNYSIVERLTNKELNDLLDDQNIGTGIALFDICESGEWDIVNPNYITISAAQDGKTGGVLTPDFSFGASFFRNLTDIKTDTNNDGKVSVKEAYELSKSKYEKKVKSLSKQGKIRKNNLPEARIKSKKINPANTYLNLVKKRNYR